MQNARSGLPLPGNFSRFPDMPPKPNPWEHRTPYRIRQDAVEKEQKRMLDTQRDQLRRDTADREAWNKSQKAIAATPLGERERSSDARGWGLFFLAIVVMATIWAIVVNSQPAKPPRTDNQRPQGVTEEQFKKDPTFGKLQIAKFGSVYKYYDTVFMQKYLWQPDPNKGCTFSKTAPDDDVKTIREIFTTYRATTISSFEVVSRNREIPRKNLIPVADLNGDGVPILTDSNTTGEAYYYSPPASASPYELEKAAALLRNNEK
jgi:hypothetical protein